MNLRYPNIDSVSKDGKRFYPVPGTEILLPSITTILGNTVPVEKQQSLEKWRNGVGHEAADAFTQLAADRGTEVHLLLERTILGQELVQPGETFREDSLGMVRSLKLKLRNITKVYGQEAALYSTQLGVAGRCDMIAEWKGVMSIIDYKTTQRVKTDHHITDYKLQLCAYAWMHNEMFGTDISKGIILMASASSLPKEFVVDLRDYEDDLIDRCCDFYDKFPELIQPDPNGDKYYVTI